MPAKNDEFYIKMTAYIHKIYKSKYSNLYEGLYCDANFYPVAGGKVPVRMRRQKRKFTTNTFYVIIYVSKFLKNEQFYSANSKFC